MNQVQWTQNEFSSTTILVKLFKEPGPRKYSPHIFLKAIVFKDKIAWGLNGTPTKSYWGFLPMANATVSAGIRRWLWLLLGNSTKWEKRIVQKSYHRVLSEYNGDVCNIIWKFKRMRGKLYLGGSRVISKELSTQVNFKEGGKICQETRQRRHLKQRASTCKRSETLPTIGLCSWRDIFVRKP